jgi:methyl-accepting chemotaxis protein
MDNKEFNATKAGFFRGISLQIQLLIFILSAIGIAFAIKNYLQINNFFGQETSAIFLEDLLIQIAITVAANLIIGLIIYEISSKRMVKIFKSMKSLTKGHYEIDVPYTEMNNEIGSIARRALIFQESIIDCTEKIKNLEAEKQNSEAAFALEKEKLTNKLNEECDAKIKKIIDMVKSSSIKMEGTSHLVSTASEANHIHINNLTSVSKNANDNATAVANASEKMSAAIDEISKQITKSSEITRNAVRKIEDAGNKVTGLSSCATEIGNVITIINSIAEKINLLSLNANIEAVRAGSAGKGFSLVAAEVKNLANQTADATEEISQLLSGIQKETGASAASIELITTAIREIDEISSAIASAIYQQNAATQTLAINAQAVAANTNAVNDNARAVLESTLQNGKSVTDMFSSCTENSELLSKEIGKFLSEGKE